MEGSERERKKNRKGLLDYNEIKIVLAWILKSLSLPRYSMPESVIEYLVFVVLFKVALQHRRVHAQEKREQHVVVKLLQIAHVASKLNRN